MKKALVSALIFGAALGALLLAETQVGTWVNVGNGSEVTISTSDGTIYTVSYTSDGYSYYNEFYTASMADNFYNNTVGGNPDRWREES